MDSENPLFYGVRKLFELFNKMVEEEGFEPSNRYSRLHAFQACALNRSAIPPKLLIFTLWRTQSLPQFDHPQYESLMV